MNDLIKNDLRMLKVNDLPLHILFNELKDEEEAYSYNEFNLNEFFNTYNIKDEEHFNSLTLKEFNLLIKNN